jgi:hypothetical protein
MSLKNQYNVKAYLKGFHEIEIGQKIADCEFGFDHNRHQYFLSATVSAENIEEAKRKGALRLNQVLSVFVIHLGMYYSISAIGVDQIAGEQPFVHSTSLILGRTTYLPIGKEEIEEIENSITLLDKLPIQESSTKRIDRAINYFLKGCRLETQLRSESFLNFYKVIELISDDFGKDFNEEVSGQLKTMLLKNVTEKEINELRTRKRLIQFACNKIGITFDCDISKIVELRNKFSAHARLKEVNISRKEFNDCKILASRTIIKYAEYIS